MKIRFFKIYHSKIVYFLNQIGEGFRGRPITTLPVIINQELEMIAEHRKEAQIARTA